MPADTRIYRMTLSDADPQGYQIQQQRVIYSLLRSQGEGCTGISRGAVLCAGNAAGERGSACVPALQRGLSGRSAGAWRQRGRHFQGTKRTFTRTNSPAKAL